MEEKLNIAHFRWEFLSKRERWIHDQIKYTPETQSLALTMRPPANLDIYPVTWVEQLPRWCIFNGRHYYEWKYYYRLRYKKIFEELFQNHEVSTAVGRTDGGEAKAHHEQGSGITKAPRSSECARTTSSVGADGGSALHCDVVE